MTAIRGDIFKCSECSIPMGFFLYQWQDLWFGRCRSCGSDYQFFPGHVQLVGRVPIYCPSTDAENEAKPEDL